MFMQPGVSVVTSMMEPTWGHRYYYPGLVRCVGGPSRLMHGYGGVPVFENVSFEVGSGDSMCKKVAVIAHKSCLYFQCDVTDMRTMTACQAAAREYDGLEYECIVLNVVTYYGVVKECHQEAFRSMTAELVKLVNCPVYINIPKRIGFAYKVVDTTLPLEFTEQLATNPACPCVCAFSAQTVTLGSEDNVLSQHLDQNDVFKYVTGIEYEPQYTSWHSRNHECSMQEFLKPAQNKHNQLVYELQASDCLLYEYCVGYAPARYLSENRIVGKHNGALAVFLRYIKDVDDLDGLFRRLNSVQKPLLLCIQSDFTSHTPRFRRDIAKKLDDYASTSKWRGIAWIENTDVLLSGNLLYAYGSDIKLINAT